MWVGGWVCVVGIDVWQFGEDPSDLGATDYNNKMYFSTFAGMANVSAMYVYREE